MTKKLVDICDNSRWYDRLSNAFSAYQIVLKGPFT